MHKKIFNHIREKNYWSSITLFPGTFTTFLFYRKVIKKGDFPNSEYYANSYISIPLFPGLKDYEQKRVVDIILKATKNLNFVEF